MNRSRPWAVIAGGAAIGALSSFATHAILPALSSIRSELHSAVGTTQLIVSVALLSIGVGQFVVGPLSDRYGRRPIILTGLALYIVASLAAGFAPGISWLIAARALQAFGCGGAIAVSRAIIMDYFGPARAAVGIAYTSTAVLLVPMFAPTLGGYLAEFLGWRWIFAICALLGVLVFVFTWIRISETHAPNAVRPPSQGVLRRYVASYRILLCSPRYVAFVAFGSTLMASMYTVITGAPYVVIDVMHVAPSTYGTLFLIPALGSFSGFFLAAKLSRRLGALRILGIGVSLALLTTVTMTALLLLHYWHPIAIFLPALVLGFANALSTPSSVSSAIGTHPEIAGAASGLIGFMQLALSAAGTQLVANLANRTPLPLAFTVLALVVASLVAYLAIRRQDLDPQPSPEYDGSETVAM